MIIKHLDIDGFGVFHNKRIDGLGKGVNVMYGPNEAGKSTLLDFVRFTLFDYPTYLKDRRPPINGGNHGGSILLGHTSGQDLLVHRKGNKQFSMELNGEMSDDVSVYNRLTNFASEQLFKNIFAITVDELNDLDKLDESGMKDRIFSMGMGLSNVNLGDIEKKFIEQSEDYFKGRAHTKKLPTITKQLDDIEVKISVLESNIGEYDTLQQNEKELAISIEELKKELELLKIQREKWQNYQKAFTAFADLIQAHQMMEEIGDTVIIPNEINENLKEDKKTLQRLLDEQTDQSEQLALLTKQFETITVNEALLPHHDLIDYLTANISKFSDVKDRLRALKEERKALSDSNELIVQGLGNELKVEQLLQLSDYNLLRAIASENRATSSNLKEKLVRIKERLLAIVREKEENEILLEQIASKLSAQPISMEKLRDKDIELTTIIEGLKRKGGGSSIGNEKLLFLAIASIVVTVGITFINSLLSLIPGFIALFLIVFYLRSRKANPDSIVIDHSSLIKERRAIQDEFEKLNKLTDEESRLKKQLQINSQNIARLEIEQQELVALIEQHQKSWTETVEKYHLPAFILPEQISDVIQTSERLKSNAQELKKLDREEESKKAFIDEFSERLSPVTSILERKDEVIDSLNTLKENLENWKQKEAIGKRIEAEESRLKSLEARIAQQEKRLVTLFAEFDVSNEAEFYEKIEKSNKKLAADAQANQAKKEIAIICGVNEVEKTIVELKKLTKAEVDGELMNLKEEIDGLTEKLTGQTIEIGALRQRISDLLNIDEMYALQNEREALKAQLEEEYHEWLINKVALAILNKEKQQYEREKQPSVIKHASTIFEQITHGKYTGLSVSLTDNDVKIHTKTDKTVAIDTLSRGTKEQLLLALRLGFIQAYEEKSEPLPIVLDDVMVNFDNKRAQEFVTLLTDFSKNRQAIIFTCHEHLRDLFKTAGARIVEWA